MFLHSISASFPFHDQMKGATLSSYERLLDKGVHHGLSPISFNKRLIWPL